MRRAARGSGDYPPAIARGGRNTSEIGALKPSGEAVPALRPGRPGLRYCLELPPRLTVLSLFERSSDSGSHSRRRNSSARRSRLPLERHPTHRDRRMSSAFLPAAHLFHGGVTSCDPLRGPRGSLNGFGPARPSSHRSRRARRPQTRPWRSCAASTPLP